MQTAEAAVSSKKTKKNDDAAEKPIEDKIQGDDPQKIEQIDGALKEDDTEKKMADKEKEKIIQELQKMLQEKEE